MKKILCILGTCLLVSGLTACSSTNATTNDVTTTAGESSTTTGEVPKSDTSSGSASGPITVVSREDGSGTRGAFIELFGIEESNESGEKMDLTTQEAEITNSTAVMMTTIAQNENSIGYISLGSMNDQVKAVKIDGIEASIDTVKDKSYPISRPFQIVTKDGVSDLAKDFISFITSEEGQKVVEENGYVSEGNTGSYVKSNLSGKIVVAGSSSVTPVMEKLKESYLVWNPDVTIEVQQSDSTTGAISAIEGVCDIGMISRDIKDSERESGLTETVIALDGIAVIVSLDSPIDQLTKEQVKSIYTGDVINWDDI